MPARLVALILAAVALVVGCLWLWLSPTRTREPAVARDAARALEPGVAPSAPAGDPDAPARAAPLPEPAPIPDPALRRAQVDRKREQIRERLREREVDDARSAPAPGLEPPPTLDKEYIRAAVRELIPVARECYEQELADDPKLAGKLVMQFRVIGDDEVGGVIDEVVVDAAESTLHNDPMRECMRESMYTLELPAPADGGTVEVTYPFMFEPD